jgi:YggT family protein
LKSIEEVVKLLSTGFYLLIFARVILSWFSYSIQNSYFALIIYLVTEPILRPVRRIVAPITGPFDISPLIALLLLNFIEKVILRLLGVLSQ